MNESNDNTASTVNTEISGCTVRRWTFGPLESKVEQSIDNLARSDDVRHIAIMPDVHLAKHVCVGTAFATNQLVYIDAVGGDIGCGMAAIGLTGVDRREIRSQSEPLLREIQRLVPISRHRRARIDENEHLLPDPERLSVYPLQAAAKRDGLVQLGTLGGGNHFLEMQQDVKGRLWLMVHSGSRAMGQVIRAHHAQFATLSETKHLHLDSDTGVAQTYLADAEWARDYARTSRKVMLDAVAGAAAELFGAQILDESYIDCDHNHVQREEHFGLDLLVHRKGAMCARDGLLGLLPGSMAGPSFHVKGRGEPDSLNSSAHGAGRKMSRSKAKAHVSRKDVQRALKGVAHDPTKLTSMRDEAPAAYKDIRKVIKAQSDLTRVVRTLMPVAVYKS